MDRESVGVYDLRRNLARACCYSCDDPFDSSFALVLLVQFFLTVAQKRKSRLADGFCSRSQ